MVLKRMRIKDLSPHPRNPRAISEAALEGLTSSIREFDCVQPPIWNQRTGRVVGGHQRLKALAALGRKAVEVVVVDLDEDRELALNVTLNSRHIAGEWTQGLEEILEELEASMGATFVDLRLDRLHLDLDELSEAWDDEDASGIVQDEVPAVPETAVSQPGDLWLMGRHRLLCGDSTTIEAVRTVMDGKAASICFTDPPWNVAYGSSRHPSWKQRAIANDDLGEAFPAFCASFCARIKAVTEPGAALYLVMSAQEWPTIDATLRQAGFHWSSTIIWAKDRLVLSRKDYHTQYEPIWYGWNGDASRLCPLRDRTQSDVWSIARPSSSDDHPTMKPVALVARALTNSSKRGAVVFEPFAGSGSTLIAAEQTERCCFAIELEPRYVDLICKRWLAFTGESPVRAADRVRYVDLIAK